MTIDIYNRLEIPVQDRATSIQREHGAFIHGFLEGRKIAQTLEVGFAYGGSAVHIMAATGAPHIAIDPYQDAYQNLGLKNVAALGLAPLLRFEKRLSHLALPALLAEGVRLDFAFIDGGHRSDEIFIDWYYIDLMLKPGGFVMFDDAWMRSTQLVSAFVRKNRRDYRPVALPATMRPRIVLFEKTGAHDRRAWFHFREFYTWRSFYRFHRIRLMRLERPTMHAIAKRLLRR